MASLNKVVLIGNLCKDVELRSAGATSVAQMRLAINESFTSKSGEKVEKAIFVDIEAWDKLADNCAKLVGKGCSVLVEGRLQMDEWEDKETGKRRTKIKVRADRVEFLTYKNDDKDSIKPPPPDKHVESDLDKDIPF